jgi:hypothetical protein
MADRRSRAKGKHSGLRLRAKHVGAERGR